jgi:diguanylate cyclase (GGDEF)-like protein/PAS domain S-box-containing protein
VDEGACDLSDKKTCCQGESCCRAASHSALLRAVPDTPTPAATYGEDFYKRLIDNLYDAVYFVDSKLRITFWNRAAEQLTGYNAAEVLGRQCGNNLLVDTDEKGFGLCSRRCPLSQSMLDGCGHETDVYLRHKAGHRVPVSVRVSPIFGPQGDIVGAVEVLSDNAAKKEAEQKAAQLEQLAFLDSLTRIPNRRFLDLRLSQILEESRRYGHGFGLMLVDVDQFKQINDQYGHSTGDAALMVIAQTLTRSLRSVDNVGRWGGDEFMAILPEVTTDGLQILAERCRVLLEQSTVVHPNGDLRISVSIGGTVIARDDSPESAVQRADERLYESKKQGRNQATVC